ncbi:MAG: phospholipase A [Cobetia amphilecti]
MPLRLASIGFRSVPARLSGVLATVLLGAAAPAAADVPYTMDAEGRVVLANGKRFAPEALGMTAAQARAGAMSQADWRELAASAPGTADGVESDPRTEQVFLSNREDADYDRYSAEAAETEGAQGQNVDAPLDESLAQQRAKERVVLEDDAEKNPLAITAYKRNYLLPWAYNTNPDANGFAEVTQEGEVDKTEVKYQLSLKVELMDDIFGDNGDLFFAYTQRSWWQAYNSDASAPFRETNYEPEAFLQFDNRYELFGWTNTRNRIGFAHQSNGRSDPLSRSWNRVYADMMFQNGDWAIAVTPHWRVPEESDEDDNPDLYNYIGYGDITVGYTSDQHEVTWMVRGNPSKGNYGNQLDYSFPLFGKVRGYVQYYHGYGESLIDYDHSVNRFGLGFSINTFFAGSPET